MECFQELVRLLLGDDACPDKKAGHGTNLCVLGIDVRVTSDGYSFSPAEGGIAPWGGERRSGGGGRSPPGPIWFY